MNKIHIFSSPRSGTHYLESLINRMLDISIVPTPFEERNAFNIDTKELSNQINEFNSIIVPSSNSKSDLSITKPPPVIEIIGDALF